MTSNTRDEPSLDDEIAKTRNMGEGKPDKPARSSDTLRPEPVERDPWQRHDD